MLRVQRNYIHVRPVGTMKEALKTDYKRLLIPHFMHKLAAILGKKADEAQNAAKDADTLDICSKNGVHDNFCEFMDSFQEGEMFMVTDSVIAGAVGKLNVPVVPVLGITTALLSPMVGVGVGENLAVLRRTTFVRSKDAGNQKGAFQVYTQSMKTSELDFELDFNWWMRLFQFSKAKKNGVGETRAYIFKETPKSEEDQEKLKLAVKALFEKNETETLANNFPFFKLQHKRKSGFSRTKFLRWQSFHSQSDHQVRIEPPADTEAEKRFLPQDQARQLREYKILREAGTNDFGFLADVVNQAAPQIGFFQDRSGNNPAGSFLGKGKWTEVRTEAETTPNSEAKPLTTVERKWGGWTLSKKNFFKILDEIEPRLRQMNVTPGAPLIRRDQFEGMKALQLYQIGWRFSIYADAMKKLRAALYPKGGLKEEIDALIGMEDRGEFLKWCGKNARYWVMRSGHRTDGEMAQEPTAYRRVENGTPIDALCIKPWMKPILELTEEEPGNAQEEFEWATRIADELVKAPNFSGVVNWLGRENVYSAITVSGFRTQDNEDTSDYISDTIGKQGAERDGIYSDFSRKYGLMSHELHGSSLGEDF